MLSSTDILKNLALDDRIEKILKEHNLFDDSVKLGEKCKEISKNFSIPEDVAFICGFLRDIGKPFAGSAKTGYSHIGASYIQQNLISRISDKYSKSLLWAIDNHKLFTPENKNHSSILKFKPLISISLSVEEQENSINMLSMLLTASSSISAIESVEHFEAIKETLVDKQRDVEEFCLARKIANKRVIISLIGEEESKLVDFFASYLKNSLSKYKIAHVKREDNQNKWINTLNNLFEETSFQVLIIQSAEMQHSNKWKSTLKSLSEDSQYIYMNTFKIGMYIYSDSLSKQVVNFPITCLETAVYNQSEFDIGVGCPDRACFIASSFLDKLVIPSCAIQTGFIELIDKCGSLDAAISMFTAGSLTKHLEFENDNISITTIHYISGLQIYNGPSRDYRGDIILFDKIEHKYHLLRGCLPVFPDFKCLEGDPKSYPYILDVWEKCMSNQMEIKNFILKKEAQIKLTCKYDGSLFNLVFIPKETYLYNTILKNINIEMSETIKLFDLGLLIFGSNGRMNASTIPKEAILTSIKATYSTIERFIESIKNYLLTENLSKENVTFRSHSMQAKPHYSLL